MRKDRQRRDAWGNLSSWSLQGPLSNMSFFLSHASTYSLCLCQGSGWWDRSDISWRNAPCAISAPLTFLYLASYRISNIASDRIPFTQLLLPYPLSSTAYTLLFMLPLHYGQLHPWAQILRNTIASQKLVRLAAVSTTTVLLDYINHQRVLLPASSLDIYNPSTHFAHQASGKSSDLILSTHGVLTLAASFLIPHPLCSTYKDHFNTFPSTKNYVTSTMRTSSTSGPVNMCRLLIHKYSCGHSKTDVAPCAGQRGGGCPGTTEKTVTHKEKCARCGKCQSADTQAHGMMLLTARQDSVARALETPTPPAVANDWFF